MNTDPIIVDIVSDTVCPWCYVGKRRVERAIKSTGAHVVVRWHPFQLDATVPPEGASAIGHLERKYGPEQARVMKSALRDAGVLEGIPFQLDAITRRPNTVDSHRLIRWATAAGVSDAMVEGLFHAYFVEGRDIGDRSILVELAAAAGLDPREIVARLETDEDSDAIQQECAKASRDGVSGVPTITVAGRYRFVGAQDPSYYVRAINLLTTPPNADNTST